MIDAATIKITEHCCKRWLERTGSKKSVSYAEKIIRKFLSEAKEVVLANNTYAVKALLNNNYEPAEYYQHSGWIIVVVGCVAKTIHKGEAKRWIAK